MGFQTIFFYKRIILLDPNLQKKLASRSQHLIETHHYFQHNFPLRRHITPVLLDPHSQLNWPVRPLLITRMGFKTPPVNRYRPIRPLLPAKKGLKTPISEKLAPRTDFKIPVSSAGFQAADIGS